MRALSIRQPYAEMILRGIKRIEYRSRPTRIVGERFWIYASKTRMKDEGGRMKLWSKDLSAATPPPWIIELANALELFPHELPTGLIVGSAVIEKVTWVKLDGAAEPMYRWHLADAQRLAKPRKPRRHPQPVWFEPF